jgi:hypothetical protein
MALPGWSLRLNRGQHNLRLRSLRKLGGGNCLAGAWFLRKKMGAQCQECNARKEYCRNTSKT